MPYLSQQAIDVDGFVLTEPIDSEYGLYVMRRVPRRVEDDDAIGRLQVYAQTAGPRRDEEQPQSDDDAGQVSKNACATVF